MAHLQHSPLSQVINDGVLYSFETDAVTQNLCSYNCCLRNGVLTLSLLLIIFICRKIHAQVSIADIQTPVSPGFILADQTPSSVNRPTDTKGFVGSLLSLNRGGAVEFAPYWLIRSKSRDNLSFTKMINTKILPLRQTFSISATSFRSDTGSYLSLGGKVQLFRVYGENTTTLVNDLINLLSVKPADLDLTKIEKLRDSLSRLKPTFVVELASAWLGYTQQNSFEQLGKARTGIWANIAWRLHQMANIILLGRYINNKSKGFLSQEAEYFDVGGSTGYESKNNRFSINAEYIYRNNKILKKSNYRLSAVANYKIADQLYVVGSFGKNFGDLNNIIALFGINVGIKNKALSLN